MNDTQVTHLLIGFQQPLGYRYYSFLISFAGFLCKEVKRNGVYCRYNFFVNDIN